MPFSHISYETNEQLIELLHDASMSKDERDASTARCLKQTLPTILRWFSEEAERGLHPCKIYENFIVAFITSLSSLIVIEYRGNEAAEIIHDCIEKLAHDLLLVALDLKKNPVPENVGKT